MELLKMKRIKANVLIKEKCQINTSLAVHNEDKHNIKDESATLWTALHDTKIRS